MAAYHSEQPTQNKRSKNPDPSTAILKFSTDDSGNHVTLRTMTTISDDEFINTLTSLMNRPVKALSDDHIYFHGPDPQIMMHVWREDGFYFGGTSER